MPKSKLQKSRVAPGRGRKKAIKITEESPAVPTYSRLVMEERDRLTAILNDPVFIKAWKNARLSKPSAFAAMPDHFEGQFGDNRAAHRLAQIQGWEMHEAALIRQTIEIVPKPKANPEEYPDTATLEAELLRKLQPDKKK